MKQHAQAGAVANAPGTGLENRDSALPWPLAERTN
jgi:hypothetical protein